MIEGLFVELRSKLSPSSVKELDRIVKYPEVQALISQADADNYTEREDLFRNLGDITKKYAKPISQAIKSQEASALRLRELEQQLQKAKSDNAENERALHGLQYIESMERRLISEKIISTADTRLHKMMNACDMLIESVRSTEPLIRVSTRRTLEHWKDGLTTMETNGTHRDSAIIEASTIRGEILETQMQLIKYQEVTIKIEAWIQRLKNKMSALDLDLLVPKLDDSGAIKIVSWQEARSIQEKSSPKLMREVK